MSKIRRKEKERKINTNGECVDEIGELSSVKNSFWVTHVMKRAEKSPKQQIVI